MEGGGGLSQMEILAVADSVGLDSERLQREMQDPQLTALLRSNHALAEQIGITATPAFIIGNTLIPGAVRIEELRAKIAAARAKAVCEPAGSMRRRRAATAIAARGAGAPSRPAMLTLVGLDQRGRASGQGAKSSYPQRPQSEHARKPPARCLRARDPRRCREEDRKSTRLNSSH